MCSTRRTQQRPGSAKNLPTIEAAEAAEVAEAVAEAAGAAVEAAAWEVADAGAVAAAVAVCPGEVAATARPPVTLTDVRPGYRTKGEPSRLSEDRRRG
jgi:hypothetical protein